MILLQRIFWAQMLAGAAALAVGYAITGHLAAAFVFVMAGAIWFAAQHRREHGLEGLMLMLFAAGAAVGLWLGAPGWLMLIAVVTGLGAWDMDHFLQRVSAVEQAAFETGLGREHLRRLFIVQAVGLFTGLLALTVQTRIPFWWETLLALLAVLGISRIIAFIRRQTED